MTGKGYNPNREKDGKFAPDVSGKTPPPSNPLAASTNADADPVESAPQYSSVYEAYETVTSEPQNAFTGVTKEDVAERSWMRDQAERMGMDPDTMVGPEIFTAEEWEAMTGTREARIAFGYELQCGCRPGTCSSEYGGDCWRAEAEWEQYQMESDKNRHEDIVNDASSVFYTDANGRRWLLRELEGRVEYAPEDDAYTSYEMTGTVETVMSAIEADNDYLSSW